MKKNNNNVEIKIRIKGFNFNISVSGYDSIKQIKNKTEAQEWVLKNIYEKIGVIR